MRQQRDWLLLRDDLQGADQGHALFDSRKYIYVHPKCDQQNERHPRARLHDDDEVDCDDHLPEFNYLTLLKLHSVLLVQFLIIHIRPLTKIDKNVERNLGRKFCLKKM